MVFVCVPPLASGSAFRKPVLVGGGATNHHSIHKVVAVARRLCRFGVRQELPGESEEMVGDFPIRLVFGRLAFAEALKVTGDD